MKDCEIRLSYYKQGCDLHHHLEKESDVIKAFKAHAKHMREVGDHLDAVATMMADFPANDIQVQADTHLIALTGPAALVDSLIKAGLANAPFWPDEDDQSEEG